MSKFHKVVMGMSILSIALCLAGVVVEQRRLDGAKQATSELVEILESGKVDVNIYRYFMISPVPTYEATNRAERQTMLNVSELASAWPKLYKGSQIQRAYMVRMRGIPDMVAVELLTTTVTGSTTITLIWDQDQFTDDWQVAGIKIDSK